MINIQSAIFKSCNLAKPFEGFRSVPYLCPAAVASLGYGSTVYEDGTRVTLNDGPINEERGSQLLEWHMRNICLPAVMRLCPLVENDNHLAAILDFTYNLGVGALASSTLRKRINAGDWNDVPTQLRKWVNGGGKRLKGLVIRREAEITLIKQGQ